MMKQILILFCLMTVAGCLKTRNEVREVQQTTTVQKTAAEASNRIEELQNIVRDLNGRIEQLENRVTAEQGTQQKQQNQRIEEMQTTIRNLQLQVTALQDELNQVKDIAAQPVITTGSTATMNDAQLPTEPYAQGEYLFKQHEWKKAVLSYQKYREANPKGKNVVDATYKIGVCFQELGLRDEAKTFYEEVMSRFAKSTQAKKAKIRISQLK
jgi:TolA-binding protein